MISRYPRRSPRDGHAALFLLVFALGLPAALAAPAAPAPDAGEDVDGDVIDRAKAARGGAGLRVGAWAVRDLTKVDGSRHSKSPNYEGYFQKGLDLHLVVESTLGLWRWVQEIEEEGGALSSGRREAITTYLVPAFSGIKFYPVTRPGNSLEPYARAAVGLALGIEDFESSGAGPLGSSAGSGTSFATGFGFHGGLGLDWVFSRAFGLTAGGRYQWLRFSQAVGRERTYKGLGLDVGLTYRFRY
jgi:hypothetical protein